MDIKHSPLKISIYLIGLSFCLLCQQNNPWPHISFSDYDLAPIHRNSQGRIIRDPKAKKRFMIETGYPYGRSGYVIDHIIPLKRGGCDCPENMQWQTIDDAKAKDRWE